MLEHWKISQIGREIRMTASCFDHLVRSELTSAAWETLVIHTEGLAGSWQGERAEGWHRLLECGPTFLFNVLSVLIGVFHALSSQRVALGTLHR